MSILDILSILFLYLRVSVSRCLPFSVSLLEGSGEDRGHALPGQPFLPRREDQ